MRGNFGLFCSFSPKLPLVHVGLHWKWKKINKWKKLTVKSAIEYESSFSYIFYVCSFLSFSFMSFEMKFLAGFLRSTDIGISPLLCHIVGSHTMLCARLLARILLVAIQ